jgi:hypothetical protein
MKTIFRRAVYAVAGLALLLDGLALIDFLLHPLAGDAEFQSPLYRAFLVLVLLPLTLAVAFLIIKRVPGNIVGPLLIVWSGTLANLSVRASASDEFYALYAGYEIVFGWYGLFLTLLHFPDGKIFSTLAFRWVYRLIPLNILSGLLIFFSQHFSEGGTLRRNPLYVPDLGKLYGIILAVSLIFVVALLLFILFSVIARFREGSLLERQQMKWLMLFAGFLASSSLLWLILYRLLTGGEVMTPGSGITGILFYSICGIGPPLTIGIAVLRYRLWDIDRIIRRTLVYSILTLVLTAVYFGMVAIVQNVMLFVFQISSSDLTVVLSTLAIAALFTPLRRRIQNALDRRFFRRKYDSEQIMVNFAATAREQVKFEPLVDALIRNVEDTMQPDQVSLWLKK